MGLKKFDVNKEEKRLTRKRNKEFNIRIRTLVLSIFVLVGSIMFFTYSKFTTEISVDVMHAKVAQFVFRLNYNGNGGTVATSYKDVRYKESYGQFPNVERNGYVLNGWWTDSEAGTQVTPSTEMGQENTTIYAHWIKGRFDLVVKPNTGEWETHTADQTYNMEYEEEKNIPDPTKEGYTFTGWTLNGTGSTYNESTKKFTMGYENSTLEANYSINTYTLTIDLDDGTTPQEYELDYHETKELSDPEKEGYTFTGWDNIDNISGNTYTQPASDITLTATWVANDYKWIVYHKKQSVDGNTYTTAETEEGEDAYDTNFSGTVKTYSGFNKPSTQSKKIKVENNYPPTTNVINYEYNRNQYKLTVKPNGGSYSGSTSDTEYNLRYEQEQTISNPTRTCYTFNNWTKSGNSTLTNGILKMGTEATTLTANWNIIQYSITFNPNGGVVTTSSDATQIVNCGSAITLLISSQVTRAGYDLEGWYTAATGGTKVNAGTIPTQSTTLYAHWTARNDTSYKVVHQKEQDDGTYVTADTENKTGTTDTSVTPAVKTYTGYTSPSTQTVTINGAGTTTVTYKYAKLYYVTLVAGNGIESVTGAGYYAPGASVTIKATKYDCANWSNWTGTYTKTNAQETFTMPKSQVTLTANGTANQSATTHNWEVAVETQATCETDSTEAQVCTKCGATKITHNTAMLGHTANTSLDVVTQPTCTTGGYTTHTCSRCGKTFVDTYTNALGHNYVNGLCTRCGDAKVDELSPGLYTVNNNSYTLKYTWQQLIDNGYYKVVNGELQLQGVNASISLSQYKNQLSGFLVLNNNVTKLNTLSFYLLSNLTGIYIPSSVTSISNGNGNLSGIQNIYVDANSQYFTVDNGALYTKDLKSLIKVPVNLTGSFQINSNTTTIKPSAFQYTKFSSIDVPSNVTTLEAGAFREMKSLVSLHIPSSVTTLGAGFALGNSVLNAINIDSNNPNYTTVNGIVYNKNMTRLVQIPAGITGTYTIPSTVTSIAQQAGESIKLSTIIIPDSVLVIESWAFAWSNVSSINLPNNLTTVNNGSFSNLPATSFVVPSNVSYIGQRNFQNSKTTSVEFTDTSHEWKLTLQSGGTAVSGVPTTSFSVDNTSQNATYFNTYQFYEWRRQ